MVLGLLSIGKAMAQPMKSLSKVKKAGWKAMSGAMETVKSTASQLNSMSGIMDKVMKPFNMLLKLMSNSILQAIMPAIMKLFEVLSDPAYVKIFEQLGQIIGIVLRYALEAFAGVLEDLIPYLGPVIKFFSDLIDYLEDLLGTGEDVFEIDPFSENENVNEQIVNEINVAGGNVADILTGPTSTPENILNVYVDAALGNIEDFVNDVVENWMMFFS